MEIRKGKDRYGFYFLNLVADNEKEKIIIDRWYEQIIIKLSKVNF